MAETVISLYTKLGANHHFSVMCEMRRKQLLPCMMKLGASHHFSVYGNMAHAVTSLYDLKCGGSSDFPVFREWAWPHDWWAWSPALTLMGGHIFWGA